MMRRSPPCCMHGGHVTACPTHVHAHPTAILTDVAPTLSCWHMVALWVHLQQLPSCRVCIWLKLTSSGGLFDTTSHDARQLGRIRVKSLLTAQRKFPPARGSFYKSVLVLIRSPGSGTTGALTVRDRLKGRVTCEDRARIRRQLEKTFRLNVAM